MPCPAILSIPGSIIDAPTCSFTEKQKKMLQTCQRKWNGEYCMLREVMNAEIRQRTNTKDIMSAAHSLMWKWGCHFARMDQRRWPHAASIWGIRVGRGRTGKPKTTWQTRSREKQEGTGHKQPKPGANGEDKHNNLTTNVTYCADISRKWLHRCIY